jgi:hypothetical protein
MALNELELNKVKELLASPDGKLLQAYVDQRVTQAIKKASTNVAVVPNAVERLKAIEEKADAKISELEMKTKVMKACYEKHIDFNTIEKLGIVFTDEKEIDEKLKMLAKDVELKRQNDLNEFIMNNSHKPQSGQQRDSPQTDLEKWKATLPADEQIALEKFEHKKKWFR